MIERLTFNEATAGHVRVVFRPPNYKTWRICCSCGDLDDKRGRVPSGKGGASVMEPIGEFYARYDAHLLKVWRAAQQSPLFPEGR